MKAEALGGIVYLVRTHRSWITCTKSAFDYAVAAINVVRRMSSRPLLEIPAGNGSDWSIKFDQDAAKSFGTALHRVVSDLSQQCDVADGEPEFFPVVIGFGELQMIANYALQGAFEALG